MKKIKCILFIFFLFSGFSVAQNKDNTMGKAKLLLNKLKLEKANGLYDRLAYAHAVNLYEDLAASGYKINEVYPKLGDCYENLSYSDKAETWYSKSVLLDSINPVYYLKYAQVLRSNGKYSESETWMKRYSEFNTNDSRIKNFTGNSQTIEKLTSEKSIYHVSQCNELNSQFADFGAVTFENKVVFISGRKENLVVGTYYSWNDKPFLDLYEYDSSVLIKQKIIPYKTINSKYHEGPVCFSVDHKTIYFTRDNYQNGKRKYNKKGTTCLMILKADYINGNWTNIIPLPFNNAEYSVGHPSISPDGKRLYFVSDMPGSIGGTDLYYVDILGENHYGSPVNLGRPVNTEGNEMFPFINNSGLYFSSDGLTGLGGLDIFVSKPLSDNSWSVPENLGAGINSIKDDFSFVVNADNKSGFLASNRPGGMGDDDIYRFTLSQLLLRGRIYDSEFSDKYIKNAAIVLMNKNGEIISSTKSDPNGNFIISIEPDNYYTVNVSHDGYISSTKNISTQGISESEITADVNLDKIKPFVLIGQIADKKTGEKLNGVEVTIVDTLSNSLVIDSVTGTDGLITKQLDEVQLGSHLAYRVVLRKQGYLAKTLVFDHYILKNEIDLNEFLEISMDKIDLGMDIGKLLNIKPIYFDLGKSDIRADAAIELNKIVQAMIDNPSVVIELGSHTDSRGSSKANLDLSDKRAKASVEYIISQGIDSNRIYGKGYGETQLVNRCKDGIKCSEEEHAQNRRTEFKVVKF